MLSHVLEIRYFPFINAGKWVLLDIVEGCVREGGSLNNRQTIFIRLCKYSDNNVNMFLYYTGYMMRVSSRDIRKQICSTLLCFYSEKPKNQDVQSKL